MQNRSVSRVGKDRQGRSLEKDVKKGCKHVYIYISAPHTFTCLTFTDLLSFDPFFYLFSLSSVPPSVPPPLCAGAPMPCAMYSLLFLKLLAFPPKSLLAHSYSTELLSKAPGSGG